MTGKKERLGVYTPIIAASVLAVVISFVVLCNAKPASVGDWGSLLSAAIALIALGAFTTTILLQMEELRLQRAEIATLARSAQEQELLIRRQTVVDSYRGLDEKIDALFLDSDFVMLLDRIADGSNQRYNFEKLRASCNEILTINYQGLHNLNCYKFVTEYHCFPVSFSYKDPTKSETAYEDLELPILNAIVMSGVLDAASIAKHVYGLARDIGLEDYARSVILRRSKVEPLIYMANEYEWLKIVVDGNEHSILIAPSVDLVDIRTIADDHIRRRERFYNIVAAALAQQNVGDINLYSQEATEPR